MLLETSLLLFLPFVQGDETPLQGDGTAAEDRPLPESIITAPRAAETVTSTPAKHVIVTGKELVDTGERGLPQMIGRATGVWVQETNLGGGSPAIGGLMGNQVLIVVDGVRMNDSTTRFGPNQSLNTIDPFIVERVEVIRGAHSLLYGSDALGGVILIWTKSRAPQSRDPKDKSWSLGGDFVGNTSSGPRYSGNATFATEDHGLLGVASGYDFDDLRTANSEDVPNTGYDGLDLFGAWEWAVGKGRTIRSTARVHRDFNVPRTDRMNTGFGQTQPANELWVYTLQDRRVAQITYDDAQGASWFDRFQTRLSFRTYEEDRDQQATGSSTLRQESDDVQTVGLGADWSSGIGKGNIFTWGLDAETDDVDSTRVDTNLDTGVATPRPGAFAPGARYSSLGGFVQDEVIAWDPWFLTVGLRYNYYDFSFEDRVTFEELSGNFDALVGSVEAARHLGQDYLVTAGLSQGFRAPNLDDLANSASFGGGTELGNPDLDPEKSITGELTFAAEKSLWGLTAGAYYTVIDDYVGRVLIDEGDPTQTGDEVYLRENTGEADIWGLEGSFRIRLFDRTSPFSFLSRSAYARGQQFDPAVDPETGEQPLYDVPFRRIPPLHGRVGLRWDRPQPSKFFDWSELYVLWAAEQDRLHPEDLTDPRIDPNGTAGWATLNTAVGGPIVTSDAHWSVGLYNLLDQQYRVHGSGFDAAGRALVVSVGGSI